MVFVSTRDFRNNQTKYLNLAKAGEYVVFKSRVGNVFILRIQMREQYKLLVI